MTLKCAMNDYVVMLSRLVPRMRPFLAALVAVAITTQGRGASAQALEPRSYVNTPVGINFVLVGYGYRRGGVGLDESSTVQDIKVGVHAGLLSYARSLDVWGLSGKIVGVLPVAEASGTATVVGQRQTRHVFGLGDPLLRVSVNVYGASALSVKQFPSYRQDVIVGVGLGVSAPLGQYDSTKLLNVGTNRWAVRPELGVSKACDRFTLELISAIMLFTTNDDLLGGKTLDQAPIYSLQGHLIYESSSVFWAALDTTYYAGGRTTVDGEPGPAPGNARLGLTTALSLSSYQSIKLTGSIGVYHRTANDFRAVGIAWQYRWGEGL